MDWDIDVATTRKSVPMDKRKTGLIISYKDPNNGLVNEQYIGTNFSDIYFAGVDPVYGVGNWIRLISLKDSKQLNWQLNNRKIAGLGFINIDAIVANPSFEITIVKSVLPGEKFLVKDVTQRTPIIALKASAILHSIEYSKGVTNKFDNPKSAWGMWLNADTTEFEIPESLYIEEPIYLIYNSVVSNTSQDISITPKNTIGSLIDTPQPLPTLNLNSLEDYFNFKYAQKSLPSQKVKGNLVNIAATYADIMISSTKLETTWGGCAFQIPIEQNKTYYIKWSAPIGHSIFQYLGFTTKQKEYINSYDCTKISELKVTAPENAAFLIINAENKLLSKEDLIERSKIFPALNRCSVFGDVSVSETDEKLNKAGTYSIDTNNASFIADNFSIYRVPDYSSAVNMRYLLSIFGLGIGTDIKKSEMFENVGNLIDTKSDFGFIYGDFTDKGYVPNFGSKWVIWPVITVDEGDYTIFYKQDLSAGGQDKRFVVLDENLNNLGYAAIQSSSTSDGRIKLVVKMPQNAYYLIGNTGFVSEEFLKTEYIKNICVVKGSNKDFIEKPVIQFKNAGTVNRYKYAAIGDSIGSFGVYSNYAYPNALSRLIGASSIQNLCSSGAQIVTGLQNMVNSVAEDANLVTVMLGINDIGNANNNIGDINTILSQDLENIDKSTILGAYCYYLQTLKNRLDPSAIIICISPVTNSRDVNKSGTRYEDLLKLRAGIKAFVKSKNIRENTWYYIDGLKLGISTDDMDFYFPDGLHPNRQGASIIAHGIYNSIPPLN